MFRVVLFAVAALGARAAWTADGKQLFLDSDCQRCHAVSSHDIEATAKSERMRGPDLATIGSTRDAQWLDRYLAREVELDDKKHRSTFKGSDEDRRAVADWLAELKEP